MLEHVGGNKDRYCLIHNAEKLKHLNFNLTYDRICGYLEATFTGQPRGIEIKNGIPVEQKETFFQEIDVVEIDASKLEELLEDSGAKMQMLKEKGCWGWG